MTVWADLLARHPESFTLVALEFAKCARASGRQHAALEALERVLVEEPAVEIQQAAIALDDQADATARRLSAHLSRHPTLLAAAALLRCEQSTLDTEQRGALRDAVERAAAPLARYRCAACGFDAQRHFWQCPGCLSWDSFPPRRVGEQ